MVSFTSSPMRQQESELSAPYWFGSMVNLLALLPLQILLLFYSSHWASVSHCSLASQLYGYLPAKWVQF
jgi:hypothetical protein